MNAKGQDLRLPLNLGYVVQMSDEWGFVPKVGDWVAYGVRGRAHIRATDQKGNNYKVSYPAYDLVTYIFDKVPYAIDGFERFDVGVSVGIDFRYTDLAVRVKCDLGLRDLNPSLENPQSRCYSVTLGYFF